VPATGLPAKRSAGGRITRLLVPIFFLSGASSLVYQVVWQRLLTLHYGVGSVSITLIVSVYMLGLGLGALLGGALSERLRRGLVAYCAIELAIAAFGAFSPAFLSLLGRFTAGAGYAVSLLAMFAFLLVPTLLMGATLPLLVKVWNAVARDFLRSVSLLYFANTLGASLGALATAYGLITFLGLDGAVHCAAALNVLLAVAVLALAQAAPQAGPPPGAARPPHAPPLSLPDAPARPVGSGLGGRVYPLVFASGFLAIAYEVVWLRMLGVLIKSSPYAFATSLSVYLLGIALGSYAIERVLRRRRDASPLALFFACQFLTGVAVLALVAAFTRLAAAGALAGPVQASFEAELHPASWRPAELARVFVWPVYFQLVPTLLIGASFPLLASLALPRPDREGATVGRVYFANTMGNLFGGAVAGFVLLEWLGTERALLCLASVHVLMPLLAPRRTGTALAARTLLPVCALAAGIALAPRAGELYRVVHRPPGPGFTTYLEEGVDAVVATFERGPEVTNYINGLVHGGRPDPSFAVETLEALAVAPSAARVLIIGFGTGTITETLLHSREVERVTLVELSRTLLRNLEKLAVFRRILADPRLEVVYDDGRRHLLRNDVRYDLVLMDPLRTTTAYSNNLYSLEFFELVSRRLTPCGVFMVWTDDPSRVPRTAATAFAHAAYYALSDRAGFVLASSCPFSRDDAHLRRLLVAQPEQQRGWLARWMRVLAPERQREALLSDPRGEGINRDLEPRSEYHLGGRLSLFSGRGDGG
jgi:predicted membrane-bound spermidine synthase